MNRPPALEIPDWVDRNSLVQCAECVGSGWTESVCPRCHGHGAGSIYQGEERGTCWRCDGDGDWWYECESCCGYGYLWDNGEKLP
jgi:DnaJ-class molecular chaperone